MGITQGADNAQTVLLHGGQMRAPGDECHIFASGGQAATEVAANAARAHNSYLHYFSSPQNR
jgi:hypothetical protein